MKNEFKGLRHYIDIVENKEPVAEGFWDTVGAGLGGAAGIATAPIRGAIEAGKYVYDNAGNIVDKVSGAVVQAAKDVAAGAQAGWQATSPTAVAQAVTGTGQSAKVPTTPDEIKAFQKANGLVPDGIIGPKTLATMQAKGMKAPPKTGQGASKTPAKPAAPATTAPTGTQATTDDEGNVTITQPDGSRKVVGPDGNVIPPGGGKVAPAKPTAPATPTKENPLAGATPEQIKALGGANPLDPVIRSRMGLAPIPGLSESVGYREEQSIARIVDLVNYRR